MSRCSSRASTVVTFTGSDSTVTATLRYDSRGTAMVLLEPGVYRWNAAGIRSAHRQLKTDAAARGTPCTMARGPWEDWDVPLELTVQDIGQPVEDFAIPPAGMKAIELHMAHGLRLADWGVDAVPGLSALSEAKRISFSAMRRSSDQQNMSHPGVYW